MSRPPQRALFVVLGVCLALLGSSAARAATPGEATELRVTESQMLAVLENLAHVQFRANGNGCIDARSTLDDVFVGQ